MKYISLSFVALLAAVFSARAQDDINPGWANVVPRTLEELVQNVGSMPIASAPGPEESMQANSEEVAEAPAMQALVTPPATAGGNAADEITPEISDLARGLRYDPVMIYAFVRNHVDFVPYYGCKKGAHLTLLEMCGNDIDQSALLVALLRASGYAPSYRSSPVAFSANQHILWHGISTTPYGHLTDAQFAAAIGTTASDPQLYNERMYYGLSSYLGAFGYPIVQKVDAGGTRLFGIPHVWVQVAVGGTTYQLSPSFKQYNWLPGIDFMAATQVNKADLLTDANPGGKSDVNGTTWVSDLKYAVISSRLATYTANFNNYIRANHDQIGPDEIFPRKQLVQKPILTLADADPFVIFSAPWAAGATETWTNTEIPADRMSTLTVTAGTYNSGTLTFTTALFNQPIALPAMKGRKLSLAFSGNTSTFRLDEANFGSPFTLSGATTSVRLALTHDNYVWSYGGGTWAKTSTTENNMSYVHTYKKGNGYAYAFPYSYDDPQKLLRVRQEILAKYKRNEVPGVDAWKLQTEVLNVMGLEWYSQTWRARRISAALNYGVSFFVHRFGRVAQEASYYIDAFGNRSGAQHRGQNSIYSNDIIFSDALIASAMEHGVIEQLQGGNAAAVSTVKAIYKANEDKTPIYRATSANWASISSQFTGYSSLSSIGTAVNAGAVALLPKSGDIVLGAWTGEGYATEAPGLCEMKISDLNGGYSIIPGVAGSSTVIFWGKSDPSYESSAGNIIDVPYTPHTTPRQASIDPVDLFSGAFFIDQNDLSLSGAGPLGLDFTRHYNSHLRHDDSSGLGFGWTDGNNARLVERSSTRASLCETNTYQAAPFVVAAVAHGVMHFQHTTAKEWATAALIAKWGIDQMKYNAAAVSIGGSTLEFIKMPDGTFVPPPGVNMTLIKHVNNTYTLTKRHGDSLVFDATGKLATITNTSGSSKVFNYNGDHLNNVTDAFGRTLTYTWTGNVISSIGDGTRTISFGYNSGNMTSCIDPEGKTWTYHYDADHRMDWRKDPEGRTIIENFYDAQNRVKAQRSMGDPNREWLFTWTGFINVEENPVGELKAYGYDDRGRSTVVTNPLNESSVNYYDGQDRRIHHLSPKGEWIDWYYDSDNNLYAEQDEQEEWTGYYYDPQLRIEEIIDKVGGSTTFTHTNRHQLEKVTDPLGHDTTYGYLSNGLLETVRDGENKTTTTAYDASGNPNKITCHDSTFQSMTNSARGDVLTITDPEGRIVTNTYNARRQLLTTTLPTIQGQPAAIVTNTYDDSGNLQSTTDAKGNVTSHTYNPLANHVTTTLPTLSSGNNVITSGYDLRDWATSSANSSGHMVTTEYDAAKRPAAVIDALMRRTKNTFDANGRATEIKDPLNRIKKQVWNARSEKTRTTDALNKNTDLVFDANGNRTRLTDRRGKFYQFSYDTANRLTSIVTPGGKETLTGYFNNNLVKTIREPSLQTTALAYNGKNLVSSKIDPLGSISYDYDDSGLLETVTEGTTTISRTYDERGRLKSFTTADGDLIQYRYDASNNLARITYPPDTAHPAGKQVNYIYNARNLLENVTDWSGRVTAYTYDRLGRLTGTTRPNGTSNQIAHDAANQLTSIKETASGKLISYLAFQYDAASQIKSRFRAPLANSGWQHPTVTATYDDDNRILTANGQSVVHDDDGNMTLGPIRQNSGQVNLTYNSRNQLTNADGISHTYDAEGRRRSFTDATGTTRDVIDPSGKLLIRIHPSGTKTYYVYGLGLLYEADEADATKTHHFDQVGSTIARTNDTGKVIGRAEYSAYGLIAMREGDMNTPFLYNGQAGVQTDSNGLLNMRARYYSPYLMRFLNADPIGFSGGSNWFAYADGNPISLSDPFGLCAGTLHDGTQVNADGSWKMNSHNIGVFFSSLGNTVTSGEVWERNLKNAASDPANWMSGFGMGGVANAMRNSVDNVAAAAANSGLEGAVFAQKTFGQTFSSGGKFAGQTIDDVAGSLRSGSMRAGDVPIEYIVRDGNTLMLNTRSAQALQQAGVPRSQWNAVNMTGNAAAEARLTGQLQRNGLGSGGIPNPTQSGR